MQVHRYKYLQDYRRPFSSCKSNKEWPHIALPCYIESEKELFYMKSLIVDRLKTATLISEIFKVGWSCCEMFEAGSTEKKCLLEQTIGCKKQKF